MLAQFCRSVSPVFHCYISSIEIRSGAQYYNPAHAHVHIHTHVCVHMPKDAQTCTHFQNLLLVWNSDLTEKLEMDWTEALETLAHTKCTWRIYEKWIVFFPFLIYWTLWKMTKTCIMTSSAPIAWKMPSQLLPQSWVNRLNMKGRVIFSKHKGMKSPCFQENILFMVPNTLDLNLYERQDLIFFIIHTFKNIFIHLSNPDSECSVDKTISLYPYSFKCIKQSHYVHDESGTTPSALQIL